jgi:hypothetical protein
MVWLLLLGLLLAHEVVSLWVRRRRAKRFDPERLRAIAAEQVAMAEAVRETFGPPAPTDEEQRGRLRDGWPALEERFRNKNVSSAAIEEFRQKICAPEKANTRS